MPDAFWTGLFAALPPTLMALAAFVQSIRNGQAATRAAEKAAVAAEKTDAVAADLRRNTDITAKVQQQTNGARERLDAVVAELAKQQGMNTTAIKLIQADLVAIKEAFDRRKHA